MKRTKNLLSLFIAIAFMLLSTSLFAQEKTQTADDFSSKFATKLEAQLNLSQDQTTQVQQVLAEYNTSRNATEPTKEAAGEMIDTKEEVNDAIANILDETQKTTWDNVKANFWAEVDADAGEMQKMDNEQY